MLPMNPMLVSFSRGDPAPTTLGPVDPPFSKEFGFKTDVTPHWWSPDSPVPDGREMPANCPATAISCGADVPLNLDHRLKSDRWIRCVLERVFIISHATSVRICETRNYVP
jgi:hypothetical protein